MVANNHQEGLSGVDMTVDTRYCTWMELLATQASYKIAIMGLNFHPLFILPLTQ